MEVLFYGNGDNLETLKEFLQQRNSEAVVIPFSDLVSLKERLEEAERAVLDLTCVSGKTKTEKIRNLGEEKWKEVIPDICDWQEEKQGRMLYFLTDCVLGLSFLEKDGNGEIKLYCVHDNRHLPLTFMASKNPVQEALKTIASGARKPLAV